MLRECPSLFHFRRSPLYRGSVGQTIRQFEFTHSRFTSHAKKIRLCVQSILDLLIVSSRPIYRYFFSPFPFLSFFLYFFASSTIPSVSNSLFSIFDALFLPPAISLLLHSFRSSFFFSSFLNYIGPLLFFPLHPFFCSFFNSSHSFPLLYLIPSFPSFFHCSSVSFLHFYLPSILSSSS
jgi:hypothetical protein